MIHIAFTGSREGMTPEQIDSVKHALLALSDGDTVVHHGDCIGADDQFHTIAYHFGALIEIHPQGKDERQRAHAYKRLHTHSTIVHPADPNPIRRNHTMVDLADALIAAPFAPEKNQPRSGTWATIRYALKRGVHVVVVRGNGDIE